VQNAMNLLDESDKKNSDVKSSDTKNSNVKNSDVKSSDKDITNSMSSLETIFSNMKPEEMELIMKQVLNSDMFDDMDVLDEQIEPSHAKVKSKKKNK
jgi:hypothetical protein